MKDIKILFITNQLSYTGAPLALLSLIKLCLKEEMNVNVISLVEGPLREELETLSIKPVVWDSILRNLEQFTQLAAEFDIIIANTLPAYEAIHILDRTGIPTLWWIHEGENYFDLLDTVMPDIGKLHNNIKVAAVSEVVAEIIKQRYNYEPLILMPMIDDMKIPTKTAHTQKPMFLNIGQPSFLKGQDIFIKALYMLPSNIREGCEFVFAGVEEADNEVFNLLYNAKESFNNINIYPLMKKKELMKLINKASFTVIASRSETVSLVAAESLMLSKPCIITDTCGAAKYLTDKENSFIISANDEKGMQDAIQQAFKTFEDKNKYNEMCQNARKTYERYFSKEQFETTALSLIEKVLHNEKLISVIIPCRNVAKWLPQCFLSLVRQTIGIRNIELIFVDDASDDEGATWTLLSEMEQAYPESTLVIGLDENVRQGGARNIALRYATGKYIAFVDADDFVAENFLLKVYREAESSNADIVQFGHFLFTEGGHSVVASKLTREIITINTDKDRKKFLLEEKLTCGCWNKLYKRELIERAGAVFAEKVIYEEPLFVYPLFFYCDKVVIVEEPYYYYRQNNSGTMRSDMKEKDTLFEHTLVQKQVLETMKNTKYFKRFYEEIKLYFLHSYLYETLLFAKKREIKLDFEEFLPLAKAALEEYEDIDCSPFAAYIPKQMELFILIKQGLTQKDYSRYIDKLN